MKRVLLGLSLVTSAFLISGCEDDKINQEIETLNSEIRDDHGVIGHDGSHDGTHSDDVTIQKIAIGSQKKMDDLDFTLGKVTFSNGFELNATWGIGSGATHREGDPEDTFYTITDRGVNIKCKDDEEVIGMDICEKGKIFPFQNFTPTIIKFEIDGDKAIVTEVIPLKDRDGKEISGVSNPISNFTEQAYDINGNELDLDINGVDSEAVAALEDGTFWIAEEYTSSILHIAADGKVIKRLVPAGLESEYATATYDVEGSLPAIIAKRHENRGIESISVSPDQKNLYFMMQSPLENPDSDSYTNSNHIRLYKMEIVNPSNTQEFLYVMDKPDTFVKDNESKVRKQKDVKMSEMEALDNDKIMILERISATTKLYTVDLTSETPVTEQQSANLELDTTGVTPLTKTKVFDTDLEEGYPTKVEGVAHLGGSKFLLINDNDFGIEGDKTVAKIADINVSKAVDKKQTHGRVVFFDENGALEKSVKVGILPDMVTYTHDGKKVLVANEGEVVGNEDLEAPLFDPYGTVSIIDTTDYKVTTVDFKSVTTAPTGSKIRKGAQIARDFEPEYIAVNEDDTAAYVSLQESNAVAKIDLTTNTLDTVYGLGFKDLSKTENAMDYIKDDALNITTLPSGVYGMYQPDTIKTYRVNDVDYFVTANEGDDRDDFYKETVHANDLTHSGIPDIGDLRVNPDLGDANGDGDYEALYAYGARSFSIWNGNTGALVYDSKNEFAQEVAADFPTQFNTRAKKGKWKGLDERSEKKGVEPEALALGNVNGKTYAYIGLEKQGGFFVYDITDPAAPSKVEYFNDINYSINPEDANVSTNIDDIAPEGSEVFTQDGKQYYVNANEVSGTVSVFEISTADGTVTKKDTYYTGIYDDSAAEIVEYDTDNKRLYVTSSAKVAVTVLDVSDVTDIKLVKEIDLKPYGTNVNSVAVHNGKIAVAVEITE